MSSSSPLYRQPSIPQINSDPASFPFTLKALSDRAANVATYLDTFVGTGSGDGTPGTPGPPGVPGPEGPAGPQGATGPAGSPGTGLTGQGVWVSGTVYHTDDYVFAAGTGGTTTSMFILQGTSPYTSTIAPASDSSHWVQFAAPAGPQGPAGPAGNMGLKGDKGDTGLKGDKGDTGATGTAGTQGIQGLKGDKGDKGLTGSAGAKGDTGAQGIQGIPGTSGTVASSAMIPVVQAASLVGALNQLASSGPISGNPTIITSLSGVPYPSYNNLVIEGTTARPGDPEFGLAVTLTSDHGTGQVPAVSDKVALYVAVNAKPGSGGAWAANFTATGQAGLALAPPPEPTLTVLELDIANFTGTTGATTGLAGILPPNPVMWGLILGNSGTHAVTSGVTVSANSSTNYYRGVCVEAAMTSAFVEYTTSSYGLELSGTHTIGLNLLGCNGPVALAIPNNAGIVSENGTGTGYVGILAVAPSNAVVIGNSAALVSSGANFAPTADNTYSLGISGARWATAWVASGVINTSDASLKTDIAPLPSMLSVLHSINPVTYRWIDGGVDATDVTETQSVQEIETVEVPHEDVVLRNGVPTLVKGTRTYRHPMFVERPVSDEQGNPLYLAPPDHKRKRARWLEQAAGRKIARTHRVPHMVEKQVTVRKQVARAGRRTHWGFLASDVKAAFDGLGMDFGGYVCSEDGVQHLRPDQLTAVLWKACQELAYKVETLEARLP